MSADISSSSIPAVAPREFTDALAAIDTVLDGIDRLKSDEAGLTRWRDLNVAAERHKARLSTAS